jgi:hypothetical protein
MAPEENHPGRSCRKMKSLSRLPICGKADAGSPSIGRAHSAPTSPSRARRRRSGGCNGTRRHGLPATARTRPRKGEPARAYRERSTPTRRRLEAGYRLVRWRGARPSRHDRRWGRRSGAGDQRLLGRRHVVEFVPSLLRLLQIGVVGDMPGLRRKNCGMFVSNSLMVRPV